MATLKKQRFQNVTRRVIANEMIDIYCLVYDDYNITLNLNNQEREHVDIRHCVRSFLAEKHGVGPSMIASAETLIWHILKVGYKKPIDHSTIIHSFKVVKHTLPISRPAFTRRMKNLILGA